MPLDLVQRYRDMALSDGGDAGGSVESFDDAPAAAAPAGDYWGDAPGFDLGDLVDAPRRAIGAGFNLLDAPGGAVRTFIDSGGDFERSYEALLDPEKRVSVGDMRRNLGFEDVGVADGELDAGDVVDFGQDLIAGGLTDPLSYLSFGATAAGKNASKAGLGYLQAAERAKMLSPEAQTAARSFAAQNYLKATGRQVPEVIGPNWTGTAETFMGRLKSGETGLSVGIPFTSFQTAAAPLNNSVAQAAAIAISPFEAALGVAKDTRAGQAAIKWAGETWDFFKNPAIRDAFGFGSRRAENQMQQEVEFALKNHVMPAKETLERSGLDPEKWRVVADVLETMDPRANKVVPGMMSRLGGRQHGDAVARGEASVAVLERFGSKESRMATQYEQAVDEINALSPEQRAAVYSAAGQFHEANRYLRDRAAELGAPNPTLGKTILDAPEQLRADRSKLAKKLVEAENAGQAAAKKTADDQAAAAAEQAAKLKSIEDEAFARGKAAGADALADIPEGKAVELKLDPVRQQKLQAMADGKIDAETVKKYNLHAQKKLGDESLKFEAKQILARAEKVSQAKSAAEVLEALSDNGKPIAEIELKRVAKALGVDLTDDPIQAFAKGTKGNTYPGARKLWARMLRGFDDADDVLPKVVEGYKGRNPHLSAAPAVKQEWTPHDEVLIQVKSHLHFKGVKDADGKQILSNQRVTIAPDNAENMADVLRKKYNVELRKEADGNYSFALTKEMRDDAAAFKKQMPVEMDDDLDLEQSLAKHYGHNPKRATIHPSLIDGAEPVRVAVDQLQKHVADNPNAWGRLIGIDIKNQKGLNDWFAKKGYNGIYGNAAADQGALRGFADILQEEMSSVPGAKVTMFKQGGDEWTVLLNGAGDVDDAAIAAAVERAKTRAAEHLQKQGLPVDLENPRARMPEYDPAGLTGKNLRIYNERYAEYLQARGSGFRVGIEPVKPGDTFESLDTLITGHHKAEKEGLAHGTAGATSKGGAGAPEGAGAAGRDPEAAGSAAPGAGEVRAGTPGEAVTGGDAGALREQLKQLDEQIDAADRLAREVPNYFPFKVDPEIEVQRARGAPPSSYAQNTLGKERANVFPTGHPLAGVPLTSSEAHAYMKAGGSRATGFETPIKGLSAVDAVTKYFKGGKEAVAAAAKEQTEFFLRNPVEAYAKHITTTYAKAVRNAQLKASMNSTFRSISVADWNALVNAKKAESPDAFQKAAKEFKAKYGVDAHSLADPEAAFKPGSGPAGWRELKDWNGAGKDVFMPKAAADKFDRYMDLANKRLPETLEAVAAPLQAYLRTWKGLQTYMWPTYHIRNMIGDFFNMFREGAVDAETAGDIARLWNPMRGGRPSPTGFADFAQWKDVQFNAGPHGMLTGDRVLQMAAEQGLVNTGQAAQILLDAGDVVAKKATAGKLGLGSWALDKIKTATVWREDGQRVAAFLARLRAGDDVAEAALRTEEALYNFARVGPAVNFLRRTGVAPFAAWMAKNVPAQVEFALREPGAFMATIRGIQMLENGEVSESQLPDYLKNKYNIVVDKTRGEDGKETWTVVTPNGVVPLLDLQELAKSPMDVIRQQLGPMYKLGVALFDDRENNEERAIEGLLGKPGAVFKKAMKAGVIDPKTGRAGQSLDQVVIGNVLVPLSARELHDVEGQAAKGLKNARARVKEAHGALTKAVAAKNQAQILHGPEADLSGFEKAIQDAADRLRAAERQSKREVEENERVLKRVRDVSRVK